MTVPDVGEERRGGQRGDTGDGDEKPDLFVQRSTCLDDHLREAMITQHIGDRLFALTQTDLAIQEGVACEQPTQRPAGCDAFTFANSKSMTRGTFFR